MGSFLDVRRGGYLLIYFFARKISIVRSHIVPDTIKFQHCLFVPVRPLVNSQQSVINTSVSCVVSTYQLSTLRRYETMSSNSNIVYGSFTQLFLVFAGHSMAGWAGWVRTVVLFTRHLPAAAVG